MPWCYDINNWAQTGSNWINVSFSSALYPYDPMMCAQRVPTNAHQCCSYCCVLCMQNIRVSNDHRLHYFRVVPKVRGGIKY